MPKYSLSLFGGFDLRDDKGAAVTIRSKKGKCLLAFLALAQGRKVGRDVLAALLWGDRGDTQARRSLSQELYRLRGLFAEDVQDGFLLDAESVALGENLFAVDVVNFEHGLESGDGEAAALYTGELLAGQEANQEGFDDWLGGERERLRERAVAALHEIMRTHLDSAPESAANAANRVLALDAASEEAHRALMQVHANAGRRDMALRQYEKCRANLSQELGIEPGSETTALFEKIKSEAPATPTSEPDADKIDHDQPLPLPDKPSIAVLQFDNMSDDPGQDYFAGGIADDIITGLSQSRDLFVIARNSSFTYKGRAIDIKKVGRELGVRYLLEGGVRKAGTRVRITAQLIEAETGNHLWAEKYDGNLSDIFELQDEITAQVVGAIQPTVFLAEIERARVKRPESLDAYDRVLQGWPQCLQIEPGGAVRARRHGMKAIEFDDSFAGAYSLVAWSHFFDFLLSWSADPQASLRDATDAARRAVQLDEADAQAHVILSWAHLFGRSFDLALVEAERAVEYNPNLVNAYAVRAAVFAFTGKPEEGIADAKRAIRLSPHDPFTFLALNELAICRYLLGDYAAAAETATRLVALKPDYIYGHWHLACDCAQLGEIERAREAFRELSRLLNVDIDRALFSALAPFKDPADLEHFIIGLQKAGWEG